MDGTIVIGTELDTKKFDAQIADVERQLYEIDEMLSHRKEYELSDDDVIKYTAKVEILNNKLKDLIDKKKKFNNTNFSDTEDTDIETSNNNLGKIIKKVTKWGLAVFGVRSAYMGIRQAMGTISQYDSQLATDLQYIKYALAMTIKPIVEWLINGVFTLMKYINYIWNAWFGKPLFANAGVEQFTKNSKKRRVF